jgi:uncharacterized protein YuzE
MITTTYDPEADALYVYLAARDAKARDTREVAPGVMLDFDARGHVIGIEVLSVRARDSAGLAAEAAE